LQHFGLIILPTIQRAFVLVLYKLQTKNYGRVKRTLEKKQKKRIIA
jgi:hypothetical protein